VGASQLASETRLAGRRKASPWKPPQVDQAACSRREKQISRSLPARALQLMRLARVRDTKIGNDERAADGQAGRVVCMQARQPAQLA